MLEASGTTANADPALEDDVNFLTLLHLPSPASGCPLDSEI